MAPDRYDPEYPPELNKEAGSDDGCALGVLLGSDDGCALGVITELRMKPARLAASFAPMLGSDDDCALGVLLGSDDGCAQ